MSGHLLYQDNIVGSVETGTTVHLGRYFLALVLGRLLAGLPVDTVRTVFGRGVMKLHRWTLIEMPN